MSKNIKINDTSGAPGAASRHLLLTAQRQRLRLSRAKVAEALGLTVAAVRDAEEGSGRLSPRDFGILARLGYRFDKLGAPEGASPTKMARWIADKVAAGWPKSFLPMFQAVADQHLNLLRLEPEVQAAADEGVFGYSSACRFLEGNSKSLKAAPRSRQEQLGILGQMRGGVVKADAPAQPPIHSGAWLLAETRRLGWSSRRLSAAAASTGYSGELCEDLRAVQAIHPRVLSVLAGKGFRVEVPQCDPTLSAPEAAEWLAARLAEGWTYKALGCSDPKHRLRMAERAAKVAAEVVQGLPPDPPEPEGAQSCIMASADVPKQPTDQAPREGDVVRLRCGSIKMVVGEVSGECCTVWWFDGGLHGVRVVASILAKVGGEL